MRIQFERTGGFAGMRFTATIDTDSLSSEEAQKLREMIEEANYFNLPSVIRSQSTGADSFQYKVTIEHEGRQHTVEAGEGGVSSELRALFRRLTVLARSA
jgi:hypothetical protein